MREPSRAKLVTDSGATTERSRAPGAALWATREGGRRKSDSAAVSPPRMRACVCSHFNRQLACDTSISDTASIDWAFPPSFFSPATLRPPRRTRSFTEISAALLRYAGSRLCQKTSLLNHSIHCAAEDGQRWHEAAMMGQRERGRRALRTDEEAAGMHAGPYRVRKGRA